VIDPVTKEVIGHAAEATPKDAVRAAVGVLGVEESFKQLSWR